MISFIRVSWRCFVLIMIPMLSFSQVKKGNNVLEGYVYDQKTGVPLQGVHVRLVADERIGASTNGKGYFSITVNERRNSLHINFLGYTSLKVTATTDSINRYRMVPDQQSLEEVVITGYQTIDRKKWTGSAHSVRAEDILFPGMTSIDQALIGQIPDMVAYKPSGEIGVTPSIRIRGTSTILGVREPVWVVDGVLLEEAIPINADQLNDPDFINRMGNSIAGINPFDIERIDVLKDAASTALYGPRAANGVIVVTTKSGSGYDKPTVSYNIGLNFKRRPRYTDRNIDVMNSAERVRFSREMAESGYVFDYGDAFNRQNLGYESLLLKWMDKSITEKEFLAATTALETRNTDWFKELTTDALSQQHNLSLGGSKDRTSYYASLGWDRELDVLKTSKNNRITSNISVRSQLSKKFDIALNLNANSGKRHYSASDISPITYAYQTSRAIPLYQDDASLFYYNRGSYLFNVQNELENNLFSQNTMGLIFGSRLQYRFTDAFSLSANLSYTRSAYDSETIRKENTLYAAHLRGSNFRESYDMARTLLPFGGERATKSNSQDNYVGRLQAAYRKNFGANKQHGIEANAGFEVQAKRADGGSTLHRGYTDEYGEFFIAPENLTNYTKYAEWMISKAAQPQLERDHFNRLASYATLSYSFDRFFTVNSNMRVEASNRFGDISNRKRLPIWSVSGVWNIDESIPAAKLPFLNSLSLRTSYGYQGNMLPKQSPRMVIQNSPYDPYYKEYTATVDAFPNPNLDWEKTTTTNLGLFFAMFDNRVSVNAEYYYKHTEDAFLNKDISLVNGIRSYVINSGDIVNKGFNVSVSVRPIRKQDFSWDVSTSYSMNSNRLNTLPKDRDDLNVTYSNYLNGLALVEGHPVGTFFSYKFLGLSPKDGGPIFDDYKERQEDLYGKSAYDVFTTILTPSGSRMPNISGNINNTFRYKAFSLRFNAIFGLGAKTRLFRVYEPDQSFNPEMNINRIFADRWQQPGDEAWTNVPAIISDPTSFVARDYNLHYSTLISSKVVRIANSAWDMYNYSDIRVVSANYLSIANVSLTYQIPPVYMKRLGFSNASVTAYTGNLHTFSAKELKGQTPNQGGFTDINLSERPVYSLQLRFSF